MVCFAVFCGLIEVFLFSLIQEYYFSLYWPNASVIIIITVLSLCISFLLFYALSKRYHYDIWFLIAKQLTVIIAKQLEYILLISLGTLQVSRFSFFPLREIHPAEFILVIPVRTLLQTALLIIEIQWLRLHKHNNTKSSVWE